MWESVRASNTSEHRNDIAIRVDAVHCVPSEIPSCPPDFRSVVFCIWKVRWAICSSMQIAVCLHGELRDRIDAFDTFESGGKLMYE